jgi:hypothetical protein
MSITIPQSIGVTHASSATSLNSATFGSSVTAGNTILFCFASFGSSNTFNSATDSLGNTYSVVASNTTNQNALAYICASSNVLGGANNVITLHVNGTVTAFTILGAIEVAGLSASDGSGNTNGGSSNTTQPSTGSFSTSQANDLIIAMFAANTLSGTITDPSGFNRVGIQSGTTSSGIFTYEIVSSIQSGINPTWSGVGSGAVWRSVGFAYYGTTATVSPALLMLL